MTVSPEVHEDAMRFQDRLLQKLIDALCDGDEFNPERWPFSAPQMAVTVACAYMLALKIMLEAIRDNLPPDAAGREIDFILRACKEPIS